MQGMEEEEGDVGKQCASSCGGGGWGGQASNEGLGSWRGLLSLLCALHLMPCHGVLHAGTGVQRHADNKEVDTRRSRRRQQRLCARPGSVSNVLLARPKRTPTPRQETWVQGHCCGGGARRTRTCVDEVETKKKRAYLFSYADVLQASRMISSNARRDACVLRVEAAHGEIVCDGFDAAYGVPKPKT